MPEQTHLRRLLRLLYAALIAAAAVLLSPWLLPFLLAMGLAALMEPAVRLLMGRPHLPRRWAAAVSTVGLAVLLLTGCSLLARRLWFELSMLARHLPALLGRLGGMDSWWERLRYRLTLAAPPQARPLLESALDSAGQQLMQMGERLSSHALEWAADVVAALPAAGLFLFTALLASYFISAGRPELAAFFRRQIPERLHPRLEETGARLRAALGGWLRAQGILMALTFVLLGAGFLLLGVETAILLAAGVALLDALPVFGTGTVLFPWAAVSALSGNLPRAAGLMLLYGVVWLVRSLLEPKLIADRVGLHPLAALAAMYGGFVFFGVAGMLLAPLGAVILRQLHDCGLLPLWK